MNSMSHHYPLDESALTSEDADTGRLRSYGKGVLYWPQQDWNKELFKSHAVHWEANNALEFSRHIAFHER